MCCKNILYDHAINASDCCETQAIVAVWAKIVAGFENIVIQKDLYFIQKVVLFGMIVYLLLFFVTFARQGVLCAWVKDVEGQCQNGPDHVMEEVLVE